MPRSGGCRTSRGPSWTCWAPSASPPGGTSWGRTSRGEHRYLEICLALATSRRCPPDEPTAEDDPGETKDATASSADRAEPRSHALAHRARHECRDGHLRPGRRAPTSGRDRRGAPEAIRNDAQVIDATWAASTTTERMLHIREPARGLRRDTHPLRCVARGPAGRGRRAPRQEQAWARPR